MGKTWEMGERCTRKETTVCAAIRFDKDEIVLESPDALEGR